MRSHMKSRLKKTDKRKHILGNDSKSGDTTCRDIIFKRYQLKIRANVIIYSGIIDIYKN